MDGGEFGDNNIDSIPAARWAFGLAKIMPGYAEAVAREEMALAQVQAAAPKRVSRAVADEYHAARKHVDDIYAYYTEDAEGVAVRKKLILKHMSLWPGRMKPVCELQGEEDRDTRAWFRDLGRLELLWSTEGETVEFFNTFDALKERRRELIRTYAPWCRNLRTALLTGDAMVEEGDGAVQTVVSLSSC